MENAGIANDIKGKLYSQKKTNKLLTFELHQKPSAECFLFELWAVARKLLEKLIYNSIYSIEKKELLSNVFWNTMKELEFL